MLVKVPCGHARYGVLVLLLLSLVILYLGPFSIPYHDRFHGAGPMAPETLSPSPRDTAANTTLGFQKIFALSTAPSWRTRGLQAAAAHTGIEIEIPEHPQMSSPKPSAKLAMPSL